MDLLNAFHRNIQFTVENEENGKLPYLDLLIIRTGTGKIIHDWYRKPTASGKILSFLSEHPTRQKINTALNLVRRALSLSDPSFHKKNLEVVSAILIDNAFPKHIVNRVIKKGRALHINPRVDHPNVSNLEERRNKKMTFVNGLSQKITRVIKEKVDAIQIAYATARPLKHSVFSRVKQRLKPIERAQVVYKIPCGGSNNEQCTKCYIGQTKNTLGKRLQQHKNDLKRVRKGAKSDSTPGKTAIITHFLEDNHIANYESATVIDTEKNKKKRELLECLHIYTNNTYNHRRDTEKISAAYCALLDDCKKSAHTVNLKLTFSVP